jgi:hypothetical protein
VNVDGLPDVLCASAVDNGVSFFTQARQPLQLLYAACFGKGTATCH